MRYKVLNSKVVLLTKVCNFVKSFGFANPPNAVQLLIKKMKITSQINDYFKYQEANFDKNDLIEIETETSIKLSEEYKKFVLNYGAVQFNNSTYNDFLESSRKKYAFIDIPDTIDCFYDNGEKYLVSISNFFRKWEVIENYDTHTRGGLWEDVTLLFPKEYLPIARNVSDDYFLLESESGKIFFWERCEDEWENNGNDKLGFVAKNLDEFIDSLRIEELPENGEEDVLEVN